MKTTILLFTLALITSGPAYGLRAPITSPELAFPDNASPETIRNVMDTLETEFTFVEGSFLNEFTNQRFTGPARKLSTFIPRLRECGFKLRLTFADLRHENVTFALSQNTDRRPDITITINTANRATELSELDIYIP